MVFLSTPSGWRATRSTHPRGDTRLEFLSTPSGWRATRVIHLVARAVSEISIHALRVEGDTFRLSAERLSTIFLSTPSGWRATEPAAVPDLVVIFLSTPSGWRATAVYTQYTNDSSISIHALRVEGDTAVAINWETIKISIHALRVEGDVREAIARGAIEISIHALRVEGDRSYRGCGRRAHDFYPRPPGGGRQPDDFAPQSRTGYFYPRPPGGGRPLYTDGKQYPIAFLSTPSGWRATAKTDKVFICFCAKGRRICLFKTRKEKNLPVAF